MTSPAQSPARDGYDVVVVGGGAAGLSGALTLARAGRSVLVVDAGAPRNAPADGVHNYLGREGMPPLELVAQGRREVEGYGGEVLAGTATGVDLLASDPDDADDPDGFRFRVRLDDGRSVRARRLLVTTGLVDALPDIPGLAERWGRDVLHCPFCHGREAVGRRIGILGTTAAAMHQALMWRSWVEDVTLLRSPALELSDEQAEQLAARGIAVVDGDVAEVEVADDAMSGVRLADGRVVPLQALVVFAPVSADGDGRAGVLSDLRLPVEDLEVNGILAGRRAPTGPAGSTDVPGVRVAGSVAEPMSQVIVAAAAGMTAAAATVGDLVAEETAAAVAAYRSQQGARQGAQQEVPA